MKDTVLESVQVRTDFEDVQTFRRSAIRFVLLFFIAVMVLNFIATKVFNPEPTYHDGISAALCLILAGIIVNLHRMKRFFWLWLVLTSAFFGYVSLMGTIDDTGIQVGALFLTVIMPVVGVHFIGRMGAIGGWLLGCASYAYLFFHSLKQPAPEIYLGGYSQIYDLLIMASLALTFSMIIALTLHEAILRSLTNARQNLHRARTAELERIRFFGAVSHEVRNSVNGIFGLTSSLLQDDLTAETRDKVELIQISGNSLVRVLNDTLEITRLESNSIQLVSECINLTSFLAQLEARWQPAAKAKGLQFGVTSLVELPDFILSDAARINQVLDNLLSNAIKFTQSGRVDVRISTTPQTASELELRFEVADTGCGIQPDRRERIFEPYKQEGDDTFAKFGGTGLGLYICRLIAAQMKGQVELDHSSNSSTVFSFSLPVKDCEASASVCEPVSPKQDGSVGDLRVLAVDDRIPNLRYLETLFGAWNLPLDTVESGEACLEMIQAHTYNTLLLDLNMPNMSGIELLRRVRALPKPVSHITVIVISADGDDERRRQLVELDAEFFLAKPVTPDMLWAALTQAGQTHTAVKLTGSDQKQ